MGTWHHNQFSSVQLLGHVQPFAIPQTAAHQASLSITNSRSLLKLMCIESVMPSNHLILFIPFSSCLQSFPASGSFQISQSFASDCQRIGVSASALVLPMTHFFPNLEPVCCSTSSSKYCFLTCIQVSQEAGKVVFPYL